MRKTTILKRLKELNSEVIRSDEISTNEFSQVNSHLNKAIEVLEAD